MSLLSLLTGGLDLVKDKLDEPNLTDGALEVTIQVSPALPFDMDTEWRVDCHDYCSWSTHLQSHEV